MQTNLLDAKHGAITDAASGETVYAEPSMTSTPSLLPQHRASEQAQFLPWLIVLGGVLTFFLNALVDNAVVFHDEYVYKAAADLRLSAAELYEKGAIEYIPNRLFLLVYSIASYGKQNFYIAAQFLNVVFWSIGIYFVCRLAQLLGLHGKRLKMFAGVAILLPFSIYTKYFMPESMFFCLFAFSAYLLFTAIVTKSAHYMLGAGIAAGLAYYVKPHALIFFGVTLIFLAAVRADLHGRWRSVGLYGVGFVLIVLIGTSVIDKPQSLARLGVYDQMVKGMMATSATMLNDPWNNLRMLGTVGLGHLILLLSVWTLALGSAGSAVFGRLRSRRAGQTEQPARLFNMWLMAVMLALAAVVIAFTVLVAEVGRIHSRYYCFAYPFLLLSLFLYEPAHHGRTFKIVMTVMGVGAGLAVLALPMYSSILGISLVSDSPELGFAFFERSLVSLAVLALVAAHAWTTWRKPMASYLVLAVLFVASQYYVREAQGHLFRGPYTDGRDALAVEQLLGADVLRASLVVAENRDVLSKFLFNLSVVPIVTIRPLDDIDQLLKDYPVAGTYLFLADKIGDTPQLDCEKLGERVLRCIRQ